MFSNLEKRDIIRIFYSCNRNSVRAEQRYLEEYPERQQPSQRYFSKLDQNLGEFGCFQKPRNKYGSRIDRDAEEEILDQVLISIIPNNTLNDKIKGSHSLHNEKNMNFH